MPSNLGKMRNVHTGGGVDVGILYAWNRSQSYIQVFPCGTNYFCNTSFLHSILPLFLVLSILSLYRQIITIPDILTFDFFIIWTHFVQQSIPLDEWSMNWLWMNYQWIEGVYEDWRLSHYTLNSQTSAKLYTTSLFSLLPFVLGPNSNYWLFLLWRNTCSGFIALWYLIVF